LDIVEITVESTSPFEAAVLANAYADAYRELNLQYNRQQFIMVKEFLASQKDEKLNELSGIENALRNYQEKKGIIELPEQAKALIQTSSEFQAKMNAAKIDLAISEKTLNSYKDELKKRDPDVTNYIENMATQPYLKRLQEQIADLQTQRDRAMSSTLPNAQQIIREAESRIADLRGKLDNSLAIYRNTILASSPEEIKDLTKKAFEEEAKYQANLASYKKYNEIMDDYNRKMNELPTSSIDLARLQREQLSYEKLFIQLEERYQEAIINEQSIPSNVLIIDAGLIPNKHAKPNRIMLVAIGLFVGLGFGAGFALLKKMMDNTVNTPNDIQNKDINLLAWIPVIDELKAGKNEFEAIVAKRPDAIASEAYRTLRTRIRFSRIAKETLKTILVSSPVAQEGKTTTALNLATVLANANYKTVLVDLDLRRPRVHGLFNQQRFPGLTDYFLTLSVLDAIVRKSGIPNLDYITSGTIPPNPSEILGSAKLEEFIELLKTMYDYIIIDSAPIVSVTDSEILSKIVDGTILVVSAGSTEQELMERSVETLNNVSNSFLGVVLNKFTYRNGYSSYYKQYYYYPSQNGEKGNRKKKEKTKQDTVV
jgi:tyrosine-protein kinase Etk/Wzc